MGESESARALKSELRQPARLQHSASVSHNREQSGAAISAAKTAEEFQGAQVSFLRDILRIVIIARQPSRQIICGVRMRQDGLLKTSELVRFRHALIYRRGMAEASPQFLRHLVTSRNAVWEGSRATRLCFLRLRVQAAADKAPGSFRPSRRRCGTEITYEWLT